VNRCAYCARPAPVLSRLAFRALSHRWWLRMPRTHAVFVDMQRNVCLVCKGTGRARG